MARRSRTTKTPTQGGQPPISRDVNAAARVKIALDLALAGNDWDAVARGAGYPSRGTAFKAVQRELQRTLRPACEDYRSLELRRLDALLTVYWPKAMSGDGWSMDRVLHLMERRAAYLGLDMARDANQQQAQMMIVAVPAPVMEAI